MVEKTINDIYRDIENEIEEECFDKEDLKLKEEIVCQAPSNTMFIVDTRMFHRRTPATINMLRLSFRAILKRNNLFKENH